MISGKLHLNEISYHYWQRILLFLDSVALELEVI